MCAETGGKEREHLGLTLLELCIEPRLLPGRHPGQVVSDPDCVDRPDRADHILLLLLRAAPLSQAEVPGLEGGHSLQEGSQRNCLPLLQTPRSSRDILQMV